MRVTRIVIACAGFGLIAAGCGFESVYDQPVDYQQQDPYRQQGPDGQESYIEDGSWSYNNGDTYVGGSSDGSFGYVDTEDGSYYFGE